MLEAHLLPVRVDLLRDDRWAYIQYGEDAAGGIELFDARSAALVIGSGDKVVLAALMLEHRAIVLEAKGDGRGAKQHKKRACALLDHARPHELASEAAELRARLEQG